MHFFIELLAAATADTTTEGLLTIAGIVIGGVLLSILLWGRRDKSTNY